MKNSLTGYALEMYKAIEDAIWSYPVDLKQERSGELADVGFKELLDGLLYRAAEMAASEDMTWVEFLDTLRLAWLAHEADRMVAAEGAVTPSEVVGKTVSRVVCGTVEGPHGDEPVMYFHFTDGTYTGVVMPKDEESEGG